MAGNDFRMKAFNIPIDVGDKPTAALVLRDGLQIKAPTFKADKIAELLPKLFPTNRFKIPRVLHQGIQAGVKVQRGTVVDITLVPPLEIKVGLLENSHVSLRELTVDKVATKITDDAAKLLSDKESYADLEATTEKPKIDAIFTQLGVQLNPNANDATAETAFQTLRDIVVFR